MTTADPAFLGQDGQGWVTHGPWLRVPTSSCLSLNAGQLFHLRLSDLGSILENSLYNPNAADDSIVNDLRVSSFRTKFNFRYAGSAECLIDVSIVKVNGSQMLSTQTTIPSRDMVEPINDLYEYWQSTPRQSLDFKFQRIAHKRIRMGPGRLYRNAHPADNNNQTVWGAAVYTDPEKHVSLHKSFKGKGMKLYVEAATRPPQTEYFLLVMATRPIEFTAISATRFRLEKAAVISQPGNA